MASRQTSRICFSWVFCFVDVEFALDFVLLIGIFVAFTVSTFVRFHSIVGVVGVVVAIAAVDTVGVAVASVIVAAAVVPAVVVVEHWPNAILPFVAHSYLAAIDLDNFSLALSNDVFVGGDSELVVVVDIGDNDIGGSGRCSMLRFI